MIAVKDNQPKLAQAITDFFADHLERDLEDLRYREFETADAGHGRLDERAYLVTKIPQDFALKQEWPWVKAIGYAVRLTQHADGRETYDVQYYILSRYLSSRRFGEAVRGHWGIESLHWVLDVHFREDDSRTRERTLGNNLSWLRRFAITRLQHHPLQASLRGKMQIAGWNDDFLAEVQTGQHLWYALALPIDPAWKFAQPQPTEQTRSLARFAVTAEPGKTAIVVIAEEREATETILLTALDLAQADFYVRLPVMKPAVQKALESVMSAKGKLNDMATVRTQLENQIAGLGQEQDRLRKNLQAIPSLKGSDIATEENKKSTSDLLQRYLKKLSDVETELEAQRIDHTKLLERENKARQELEKLVEGLFVE